MVAETAATIRRLASLSPHVVLQKTHSDARLAGVWGKMLQVKASFSWHTEHLNARFDLGSSFPGVSGADRMREGREG
jgi:hypothetical protein